VRRAAPAHVRGARGHRPKARSGSSASPHPCRRGRGSVRRRDGDL